jgi:hypothetical protein
MTRPPRPLPPLLLVAACGSSPAAGALVHGNDAGASSRDATVGPTLEAGAPGDDGNAASCALVGTGAGFLSTIAAIVSAMRAGGNAGSGALSIPSAEALGAFSAQVTAILGGDENTACSLPPSYRLLHLSDPNAGALRVIAELDSSGNPAPSLYWGTYAAPVTAPAHARLLAVEAPHPIFDTNTEIQAADTFIQGSALFYLLAGAHRCADAAASGCTGTTDACGATANYRISDAAHTEALPFHAVHAALSLAHPTLAFLQLHGNDEPCPDALVSDSSGTWNDAGLAATLASELTTRGIGIGQCGAGYPTSTCDLCGTDNVQARMTAGSSNACTTNAPLAGYGRFVHVEQQLSLRLSPDAGVLGYPPLIDAVLATFPAQ